MFKNTTVVQVSDVANEHLGLVLIFPERKL